MTALDLPALDGRTPLGFLAALGVLRLITEHTPHPARLAWSRSTGTAVLHDAHTSIEDLVGDLAAVVETIPADGVISGVDPMFPPPGAAPDRLRLLRRDFPAYAASIRTRDGDTAERWLASLVTDLSVDDKGRASMSLFAAPSGKQSMRTMLEKPLDLVRTDPQVLREALVAWRRRRGVSGEYLDHRVLHDAADAGDGTAAERGVPGATWLALMAYPMMRTSAHRTRPLTTGWQDVGRGPRRLIYPLWSAPLDPAATSVLLTHPVLRGASPGAPPPAGEVLSVFWVAHAARRSVPGRTFAGVLAPVTGPEARARRPR